MKKFIKNFICVICIVLSVHQIYINFQRNTTKLIQPFGYGILKVKSGSMEPTILTGSIIIIKKQENYEIGEIITYKVQDKYLITHRIIEKYENGFFCKGDNNNIQDEEIVKENQILRQGDTNTKKRSMIIIEENNKKELKVKTNNEKNKYKIYRIILYLIIILLLIITMFIGNTTAKYIQKTKIYAISKIAEPILIVEGKETTKISGINNVGYYEFCIKNYKDNKISDVSQNYTIEVVGTLDPSIEFKLYDKDGTEIPMENRKTNNIFIGNKKQQYFYKNNRPLFCCDIFPTLQSSNKEFILFVI